MSLFLKKNLKETLLFFQKIEGMMTEEEKKL